MISLIVWFFREVNVGEEQGDKEKLLLLRTDYERYKDLWGLNVRYSHSAGPTQNYSEISWKNLLKMFFLLFFCSCKEGPGLADCAHLL